MAVGRPRAFDPEEALERAMHVFWRKGYEGASLSDLTKAMGINPPSLYAAFGNKEELFRQALDRYSDGRANLMCEILGAPTAFETAERLLRVTADLLTEPNSPPGCLLVQGGLACGSGSEKVPDNLAERRAFFETTLRERFDKAKAQGDLPQSVDTAALASYLVIVKNGMAVQAASGATRAQLHQVADLALKGWPG